MLTLLVFSPTDGRGAQRPSTTACQPIVSRTLYQERLNAGESSTTHSRTSSAACWRPGGRATPSPRVLAARARPRERLCDAFSSGPTRYPVYRRLLKLTLEELRVNENHLRQLWQQMADLLAAHYAAVQRLGEVPVSCSSGRHISTLGSRSPRCSTTDSC